MPQTPVAADADPATLLEETRTFLNRGELAAAADAFQNYMQSVPESEMPGMAWLQRGRIATALARYREARRFMMRAMQDPKCAHAARYELGRTLIDGDQPERAVHVLMPLGRDDTVLIPWRAHALSATGRCLALLGRPQAAQQALESAGKFGVASAQLFADDGVRLMMLGAVDEAQGQLVTGVQMDPSCTDAIVLLAELLLATRRMQEASEVVQFGLEHSPFSLALHQLHGRMLEVRGELTHAAESYRMSVLVSPRGAVAGGALLAAARCQALAGREADAVSSLRELINCGAPRDITRDGRALLDAISDTGLDGEEAEIRGFPRVVGRRTWPGLNPLEALIQHLLPGTEANRPTEQLLTPPVSWPALHAFLSSCTGLNTTVGFGTEATIWSAVRAGLPVVAAVGRDTGDSWCVITAIHAPFRAVTVIEPGEREARIRPMSVFMDEWEESSRLVFLPHRPDQGVRAGQVPIADSSTAQAWLAAMAERTEGQGDSAQRALHALAGSGPPALVIKSLAETALADRRYGEATTVLGQLRAEGADRPRWWWRASARAAQRQNKIHKGLEICAAGLNQHPDDALLGAIEGALLLAAGRRRRGRHRLLELAEALPRKVALRLDLARDYLATGEYDPARYQLIAALELEPDCHPAARLLAEIPDREAKP